MVKFPSRLRLHSMQKKFDISSHHLLPIQQNIIRNFVLGKSFDLGNLLDAVDDI